MTSEKKIDKGIDFVKECDEFCSTDVPKVLCRNWEHEEWFFNGARQFADFLSQKYSYSEIQLEK